ncbi:MAG: redoxin domain-containing protein [Planctomycetota bacterium]|jgi:thiol-disulfide isomerase/thioredoxin
MKILALPLFAAALTLVPLAPAQAIKNFKFEVTPLGGQKLTQDDFMDGLLIVDFWGTWCGPCKRALPMLKDLYAKYKHHGLEIVGLNYEKVGKSQALDLVREFAAENGLTYHLALGTSKIQRQVPGLQSYPTMLFFKKGLEFSHLEVGYGPEHKKRAEKWVRKELGLDKPKGVETTEEEEEEEPEEVEEEEEEKPEAIEAGKIYLPGNHDKGFDFEVTGLDGETLRFKDYRGKKVILTLTTTWTPEARETAALLNQLHERYAKKGVVVLAASLELSKVLDKKIAAIKKFVAETKPRYTVFPAGIKFQKKLHLPSGLPTYLMFDEQGTLILRQKSAPAEKVLAAFAEAMDPKRTGKAKGSGKAKKKPKGTEKAAPKIRIPIRIQKRG